jgi:hypothetical protein
VMQTYEPDAHDAQYLCKKSAINQGRLTAIGPFHDVNCDGHDKLGAQALQMGGVGLLIYGLKDKWSSMMLHLVVIPNNWRADIVVHIYLDFIEKYQGMLCFDEQGSFGQLELKKIIPQPFPCRLLLTKALKQDICLRCRKA